MKTLNMKTTFILLTAFLLFNACSKSKDVTPKEEDKQEDVEGLNHSFTFKEGETGWKYEANGQQYQGEIRVINSLENDKTFPVEFMSVSYSNRGGFGFLPQAEGVFKSGHNFGKGNGTGGNDYFLTGSLIIEGETYYAYSSHAYGFLEDEKIAGADCTIQIKKFDGKYTTYKSFGITLTGFVGTVEALFAGTFKTKGGSKSIEIAKGEFRVEAKLPAGAEVVE